MLRHSFPTLFERAPTHGGAVRDHNTVTDSGALKEREYLNNRNPFKSSAEAQHVTQSFAPHLATIADGSGARAPHLPRDLGNRSPGGRKGAGCGVARSARSLAAAAKAGRGQEAAPLILRAGRSLLLFAALLPAACGSVTPYSFAPKPVAAGCLMAANPGNADAIKRAADPWWFGADGGIGGSDGVQVPYLHVTTLDYGCLLKRPAPGTMEISDAR